MSDNIQNLCDALHEQGVHPDAVNAAVDSIRILKNNETAPFTNGLLGETQAAARCDDCKAITPLDQLDPIRDLHRRVTAGDELPAGQCPKCGMLAFVIELEPESPTTFTVRVDKSCYQHQEFVVKADSEEEAKNKVRAALDAPVPVFDWNTIPNHDDGYDFEVYSTPEDPSPVYLD